MVIKIQKISTGFACYFTPELNGSFKAVFKSARFNPRSRCWEVGPRSGKRLEQWAALAEAAAQEIEEAESAELTAQELEKIEAEISTIRITHAKAQAAKLSYEQTIEALSNARSELAKAKEQLADEKAAMIEKGKQARALLSQVCDLPKIEDARQTLKQHHGKVGSDARDQFKSAQAIIKNQIDKLEAIGYRSKGLYILYWANFNRPDRDKSTITNAELYDITQIEEDE